MVNRRMPKLSTLAVMFRELTTTAQSAHARAERSRGACT
jgi:hypothetical protein